jgi:hypothetical protein
MSPVSANSNAALDAVAINCNGPISSLSAGFEQALCIDCVRNLANFAFSESNKQTTNQLG